MGFIEIKYEEGQTPLDEDEKDSLLLLAVTTRSELDELEQRNIEIAIRWTTPHRLYPLFCQWKRTSFTPYGRHHRREDIRAGRLHLG